MTSALFLPRQRSGVTRLAWDLPAEPAPVGLDFVYDDRLRPAQVGVDGFAAETCFGYGPDGLLAAIGEGPWDDCEPVMTFDRDIDTGRLDGAALVVSAESAETAYTYSGFSELLALDHTATADPELMLSFSTERDALGRVTHVAEVEGRSCADAGDCWSGATCVAGLCETGGQPGRLVERWYTYDAYDRLQGVWDAEPPAEPDCGADPPQAGMLGCWEYDHNGNRTLARECTGGASPVCTTTVPIADAQDRLLDHGAVVYEYDDRGTATLRRDGDLNQESLYTYDTFGALREVAIGLPRFSEPDIVVEYEVDAAGRRVGRIVRNETGSVEQRWIYESGLRPAAELDELGNVVSRFVYGTRVNVPEYMVRDGETYRLITDPLGSVRRVVDVATGEVRQALEYDAWGRVLEDTNPEFQPFGYAGGLYDPLTGLVRFGARDYDPAVGRWTAKDPIRFGGGDANLYAYVGNDPVNRIDPSGLAVYVGTRRVQVDGFGWVRHSMLILVPDSPSDFSNQMEFILSKGNILYLSAFNVDGWLVRSWAPTPVYPDFGSEEERFRVEPPCGMSDSDFIREILAAFRAYSNDWPYVAWGLGDGVNSNSFVAGLLGAAGSRFPVGVPGWHPGVETPVEIGVRWSEWRRRQLHFFPPGP